MTCYACDKEATHRCPRCGKPYCEEHGDDLCAACQDPASAIPSGAFFRGSLLALLVAAIFALWLLIQPPGLPGGEPGEEAVLPLPTVTPEPLLASPTVAPSATPTATLTATPTATATAITSPTPEASPSPAASPAAGATPTPIPTTPTPQPQPFIEYEVRAGDNLSAIAQSFGTTIDEIVRINGLASQDVVISVGQKLLVPNPAAEAP